MLSKFINEKCRKWLLIMIIILIFSKYLPINIVALFIRKPASTTAKAHYNYTNKHSDAHEEPTNHVALSSQISSNYFWLQWMFEVFWVEAKKSSLFLKPCLWFKTLQIKT